MALESSSCGQPWVACHHRFGLQMSRVRPAASHSDLDRSTSRGPTARMPIATASRRNTTSVLTSSRDPRPAPAVASSGRGLEALGSAARTARPTQVGRTSWSTSGGSRPGRLTRQQSTPPRAAEPACHRRTREPSVRTAARLRRRPGPRARVARPASGRRARRAHAQAVAREVAGRCTRTRDDRPRR